VLTASRFMTVMLSESFMKSGQADPKPSANNPTKNAADKQAHSRSYLRHFLLDGKCRFYTQERISRSNMLYRFRVAQSDTKALPQYLTNRSLISAILYPDFRIHHCHFCCFMLHSE